MALRLAEHFNHCLGVVRAWLRESKPVMLWSRYVSRVGKNEMTAGAALCDRQRFVVGRTLSVPHVDACQADTKFPLLFQTCGCGQPLDGSNRQ
jgi:hypothetical protein